MASSVGPGSRRCPVRSTTSRPLPFSSSRKRRSCSVPFRLSRSSSGSAESGLAARSGPGPALFDQAAIAPGGEVALEEGDQVGGGESEGAVFDVVHCPCLQVIRAWNPSARAARWDAGGQGASHKPGTRSDTRDAGYRPLRVESMIVGAQKPADPLPAEPTVANGEAAGRGTGVAEG